VIAEQFDLACEPVHAGDEVFLEQLFHHCQAPEFAPLGLPAPALQQLLAMQYRGRNMTYRENFPDADDKVLWVEGERAGRLTLHRSPGTIRVVDVAVSSQFRRRGVATRALEEVLAEARETGCAVRLEVRAGNPAATLYRRLGFAVTGGNGFQTEMTWRRDSKDEPATAAGDDSPQSPGPHVPQDATCAYFRTLVGLTLAASYRDTAIEIVLERVAALPPMAGAVAAGDSFILRFLGPMQPLLPCDLVTIVPPEAPAMEIFLSPTGPEGRHMVYEAIFNRAQR
jgi:GNAT superfamily N-acetyltransferase